MFRMARRATRRTVRHASTAAVRTAGQATKALFSLRATPKRSTPVSAAPDTYLKYAALQALAAEMDALATWLNANREALRNDPAQTEAANVYRARLLARAAAFKK
jgi:hypothetical protein